MHRLCLDRCGKGRRMGGEFNDEFFAVIEEIAPSKKELALIRQQILRGTKTFSFVSKQENFIDFLMERSKQVCENPQMITNQILGKMRTFGIDWRDNYSKK